MGQLTHAIELGMFSKAFLSIELLVMRFTVRVFSWTLATIVSTSPARLC
jgi:hypothetical protein